MNQPRLCELRTDPARLNARCKVEGVDLVIAVYRYDNGEVAPPIMSSGTIHGDAETVVNILAAMNAACSLRTGSLARLMAVSGTLDQKKLPEIMQTIRERADVVMAGEIRRLRAMHARQ